MMELYYFVHRKWLFLFLIYLLKSVLENVGLDFTNLTLLPLFFVHFSWSVKKCCTVHKCLKTIFWVKKQLIAEKDGGGEDLGGGRRFNINL